MNRLPQYTGTDRYDIELIRALNEWRREFDDFMDTVARQTGGDVTLGSRGAVAMRSGFPYIPAGEGAPTSTPAVRPGFVPIYIDTANQQLYYHDGSAWRASGAFT